ncbi:MAG: PAS domain S-box protein [Phycisphaerae bacterium]|nr:PAS domain S-box protein [Phycisphaerae bacterium]
MPSPRKARAPAAPRSRSRPAASRSASADEHYRLVFERDLAGVYRTTLDGRILECNRSFATMLGYRSPRQVMAGSAKDLYFGDGDRKAFIARLRQSGELTNSELCLRRRDGTPIYILENVSLVPDARGRLTVIQGTMVDITERKRAEEALRNSEQRFRALAADLRRLNQHLQTVREEERARIARELHDELGQALTALNMDVYWLRERAGLNEAACTRLVSMGNLLNTTIQAVRRICADLRPMLLDDLGLVAALEWFVRDFSQRTGLQVSLALPRTHTHVPPGPATAVFRILQESLTNVARHAKATHVAVALRVRRRILTMTVTDDGIGLTAPQAAGAESHGLVGMRERALRWGGQLDVRNSPGGGALVRLRMPLVDTAPEATT